MLAAGVPLIVGDRLVGGAACTWIENAGRDTLAVPSLTVITILLLVPMLLLAGVPVRVPDAGSKDAHAGLLEIWKLSVSLSASEALG